VGEAESLRGQRTIGDHLPGERAADEVEADLTPLE
jgi:hypothetical protein